MNLLKTDQEFKDLIPPLAQGEYAQLEHNLILEGCRDAIKIWKGIIVDGYNRYEICQKHQLPYDTISMNFSSRNDAKSWIIDNQLGRRNLPSAAYIELALQKAELGHYDNHKTGNKRKIIANVTGYSENTIHKYMKIRKMKDAELVKAVKTGKISIGNAYKRLTEKGEDYKGLMVTIKTVEDLCPGWAPKYNSNHIAAGIVDSTRKMAALCEFYINNYGLICAGDAALIRKRFKGEMNLVGLNT